MLRGAQAAADHALCATVQQLTVLQALLHPLHMPCDLLKLQSCFPDDARVDLR
jgi:hypothetical protein